MSTMEDLLAEHLAEIARETPEERAHREAEHAEYDARPCKYDSTRECWVHGYLPRRPCGHSCYGAFYKHACPQCRPLNGRQRTRKRWRRQGRR